MRKKAKTELTLDQWWAERSQALEDLRHHQPAPEDTSADAEKFRAAFAQAEQLLSIASTVKADKPLYQHGLNTLRGEFQTEERSPILVGLAHPEIHGKRTQAFAKFSIHFLQALQHYPTQQMGWIEAGVFTGLSKAFGSKIIARVERINTQINIIQQIFEAIEKHGEQALSDVNELILQHKQKDPKTIESMQAGIASIIAELPQPTAATYQPPEDHTSESGDSDAGAADNYHSDDDLWRTAYYDSDEDEFRTAYEDFDNDPFNYGLEEHANTLALLRSRPVPKDKLLQQQQQLELEAYNLGWLMGMIMDETQCIREIIDPYHQLDDPRRYVATLEIPERIKAILSAMLNLESETESSTENEEAVQDYKAQLNRLLSNELKLIEGKMLDLQQTFAKRDKSHVRWKESKPSDVLAELKQQQEKGSRRKFKLSRGRHKVASSGGRSSFFATLRFNRDSRADSTHQSQAETNARSSTLSSNSSSSSSSGSQPASRRASQFDAGQFGSIRRRPRETVRLDALMLDEQPLAIGSHRVLGIKG